MSRRNCDEIASTLIRRFHHKVIEQLFDEVLWNSISFSPNNTDYLACCSSLYSHQTLKARWKLDNFERLLPKVKYDAAFSRFYSR